MTIQQALEDRLAGISHYKGNGTRQDNKQGALEMPLDAVIKLHGEIERERMK